MIRGERGKSEYHFSETFEELRRQFFLTASTKQFYVSKDLGVIFFLSETSIRILSEISRNDSIFRYLEKFIVVSTERTG